MYNEFSHSPFRAQILTRSDFQGSSTKLRMDHMNLIIDSKQELGNIWLGSLDAASDLLSLKKNRITAILSLCPQDLPLPVKQYLQFHQNYYAEDVENFNISKYFDAAYQFIERVLPHANILIHCFAGISRSTTILAAYIMRKQNIGVKQAISQIKTKRWQIYPNSGKD